MTDLTMPTVDPWTVSPSDFPSTADQAALLQFALTYAVLAPSSHNTQPWRFGVRDDRIELWADRTRALPVADPADRELTISCGAALLHLRLALQHFGFDPVVTLLPDPTSPDLLARVEVDGRSETSADDARLFAAIPARRTNREPFEARPLPRPLLDELQAAAEREAAWLRIVEGDTNRNAVADLIAEGDRQQMADPRFRRELAAWIHPSLSSSHDGMPAYAHGVPELLDFATPILALVIRTFDLGKGQAARDRQLAERSPALAVIGTDGDTPRDWLAAGQALARVLLRARAADVWASYLNQPIQVPELRPRLRDLLGLGGYPQVMFRLGHAGSVKPTPRRPVSQVVGPTG